MKSLRTLTPSWPAAAAVLLLASGVLAAPPRPEEVSDPRITPPELVAHVRYLASEELQGRGPGTRGIDLAADYLAERFRAAGLKPAGEGGTFFQEFPVFTGVKLGERNAVTLGSGQGTPASLRAGEEFMPLAFSKNGAAWAPLVFAGYGIHAPELGYDDYAGLDVRGKIVLVLRHTPDMDDQGKFAAQARLAYKAMAARDRGAAGILLVTGPLGGHEENLGRFQLDSASADCGIPAVIVKRAFAERLLAPTGKTLRDLQVMIAHGQTQSFPVPRARVGLRVNVVRETARTRNVVALLEGSDPALKQEVVVIGAHYDHLGLGGSHSLSASAGPEIHHGADDNASGTAGLLELAQHFASGRARPGRSLLFIAFSGEEMGLLGSAHWTRQPTIPLARTVAMINLDMVGRMRDDTVHVIGAGTSPIWSGILEEANRPLRLQLRVAPSALSGFGGSDQQSFAAREIPVLFFFTGSHPDYHRPTDTWEKVNAGGLARLLELVADVAQRASWARPRPRFVKVRDEERPASGGGGGGFRVYLGTLPDYTAAVEGVALQGVKEGSPASKAGLRAGDVIVAFDGKSIRNVEEYTAVLSGARPNVATRIVVLRGKERLTLTVTPAPRD